LRESLKVKPDFNMAYQNLVSQENTLQHDEAVYQYERKIKETENSGDTASGMNRRALELGKIENDSGLASSLGDFQGQIAFNRQAIASNDFAGFTGNLRLNDLGAYGFLHDAGGMRRELVALPPSHDVNDALNLNAALLTADFALSRWAAVKADLARLRMQLASFGKLGDNFRDRVMIPLQAGAEAETGDFAAADAHIAGTPGDCDLCVRLRAHIATAEHRWDVAAHWFALVSARDPSIPFPDAEWGQMLLAKGDTAAAIAKFESAHTKGPHFADPLEMWGEALMTQNRSDLALEKFAQAAKCAPNWGRLHLKWGEALGYAGKKDDARTQFAFALGLDLSDAEKAELARVRK
jgi:tetratricopeptide (TPR) repeat protein